MKDFSESMVVLIHPCAARCRIIKKHFGYRRWFCLRQFLNVGILGEFLPGPLTKHIASSFGDECLLLVGSSSCRCCFQPHKGCRRVFRHGLALVLGGGMRLLVLGNFCFDDGQKLGKAKGRKVKPGLVLLWIGLGNGRRQSLGSADIV